MTKEETISNLKHYIHKISNHKKAVKAAWEEIKPHVIDLLTVEELECVERLIKDHDDSKYKPEEYELYLASKSSKMSDKYLEKATSELRQNHCHSNLHHPEALAVYTGDDYKPYLVEMLCNMMANEKALGDSVESYYANPPHLSDDQIDFMNKLIEIRKSLVVSKTRKR